MTGSAHRTFGVVLTYRRPDDLDRSLEAIASQSMSFDALVVVDNEPSERAEQIVERHRRHVGPVRYLASPTNVGAAGGRTLGLREIERDAGDDDWIVFLDDDVPLPSPRLVERLVATADRTVEVDPTTAGVGLRGARLERWSGRLVPVVGSGIVRVDHLHGDRVPCYRVGAIRRIGSFDDRLFFGFEELELGMRLRRAGYSLWADADLYASVHDAMGGDEPRSMPSGRLEAPTLRRYYALRNRLVVLGREHLYPQAWSWALVAGVLKPTMWLVAAPRSAGRHLRLNLSAIGDAATGRLGARRLTAGGRVVRP